MSQPDWQLPPGVTRSLWEFAHDPAIARDESRHLSDSPLLAFDQAVLRRWLPGSGDVLDLGCGTGRHLVELASRGWRAVGVDLSLESLIVARERAVARGCAVTLVRGNLCDLGFLCEQRFDAILLLFGTLGMISGRENRLEVLRQVKRLLNPGGKVILHVHNVWRHAVSVQGRRWLLRDLWKRLRGDPTAGDSNYDYRGIPRMYHHSFTLREICRTLTAAGLRVTEVIPLADSLNVTTGSEEDFSMQFTGRFGGFRATGWLLSAVNNHCEPQASHG